MKTTQVTPYKLDASSFTKLHADKEIDVQELKGIVQRLRRLKYIE
ncbi:MAG TPA: hypothetical protein VGE97_05880 [Nitrososphaera sp.]